MLAIGSAAMSEMLSLRRVHSPARKQRQREQAAEQRRARPDRAGPPRSNSAPGRSRRARASGRRSRPPSGCRTAPRSRASAGGRRRRRRRWRRGFGSSRRRRTLGDRRRRARGSGRRPARRPTAAPVRTLRRRRRRRLRPRCSARCLQRSSRARSVRPAWSALRAKMNATTAITSARSRTASRTSKPPGYRPGIRAQPIEICQRRPRTRRPGAGRSCSTSRRKRNSAAGRPPVCVDITPVGSTSAPASTSLRKFCLCRCRPEIASTVRCNSVSVNSAGKSSNTTGRYFSLARSRAIAVARMRRWSKRMETPSAAATCAPMPQAGRRGALPRPARLRRAARSGRARAPRPNARPRCDRGALATTSNLPRMKDCTTCHAAGGTAKDGCDVCHLTTVGGRLKMRFASGSLLPGSFMRSAEHGPDWTFRHKVVAGADSAACATCHSEEECVECHDGRVRPRQVHPNDWLDMHAVAARQDEQSCGSCHRASSFCITCHQRAGLAMSGPAGNAATRGRFDPPRSVWTDPPRTANHHAWEAERNITACVSCHTERDCATCHATAARGGQGGLSPHPAGFSGELQKRLHEESEALPLLPRLGRSEARVLPMKPPTRCLAESVRSRAGRRRAHGPVASSAETARAKQTKQQTRAGGPQCACTGVRPAGIATTYCGSTPRAAKEAAREGTRPLSGPENMYLDLQGEISVGRRSASSCGRRTRAQARRLLAKIIEEKRRGRPADHARPIV